MFLDYNQNAKDRTVASAYSVRPTPDARVSFPLRWDEVPDVVMEDFTLATVPALYAERGDAGAGIDEAVGSLEALLELSARDEAEGVGDAPWPPNYAKQEGEPPRVQPSRKRKPDEAYEGRGKDGGPPPEVAAERAAAVAAGDPNAGLPTEWQGSRPSPTGRRKSSIPVIELGRAADQGRGVRGPRALEGAPPRGGRAPRARGRPRDGDARPGLRLVPAAGQPDPRPGGDPAAPGAARPRRRARRLGEPVGRRAGGRIAGRTPHPAAAVRHDEGDRRDPRHRLP